MIKRTLYFGNPYQLRCEQGQLVISDFAGEEISRCPLEDLGYLVLDHRGIQLSIHSWQECVKYSIQVIICDEKHLPAGIFQAFHDHHTPNQRVRAQVEATESLQNRLWKQLIVQKINNQAQVLQHLGKHPDPLHRWAREVTSGDKSNREGLASRYYWSKLFAEGDNEFNRRRFGEPPNHWLNYVYAIVRGAVARSLVGHGLLPVLGINHRNKYNAYCLADDMMEPYRPFADLLVYHLWTEHDYDAPEHLDKEVKATLLRILDHDCVISDKTHPLQIATDRSSSSLAQCFLGERKELLLPEFPSYD